MILKLAEPVLMKSLNIGKTACIQIINHFCRAVSQKLILWSPVCNVILIGDISYALRLTDFIFILIFSYLITGKRVGCRY